MADFKILTEPSISTRPLANTHEKNGFDPISDYVSESEFVMPCSKDITKNKNPLNQPCTNCSHWYNIFVSCKFLKFLPQEYNNDIPTQKAGQRKFEEFREKILQEHSQKY